MPEFRCRAILFDLDGTLIDSLAAVERAWSRLCKVNGVDPADVLRRIHGRRVKDSLRDVLPGLDPVANEALLESFESTDTEGVLLLPGSDSLIAQLPPGTWTIVTSGAASVAQARLRATGLPIPPRAVYAEDVAEGKPSPLPFLAGARVLEAEPKDCLVFEDTVAGIEAAKAAGMAAIAIGESGSAIADYCVPDLSKVSVSLDNGWLVVRA